MELESSYQLLGVLRDDGIRTYNALEIASGQALQVHFFSKSDSLDLFRALRALPMSRRRELLEMGMQGDQPYVVTEKLPETVTAREWLAKLAGLPPVKTTGPVVLAGSWRTGTPLPDELLRAQSSLPPKRPAPPPEPVEMTPDYTRVMRLPTALTHKAPEPIVPEPVGPEPVGPAPPVPEPEIVRESEMAITEEMVVNPETHNPPDEFAQLFPPPVPETVAADPAGKPGTFTAMFAAAQPADLKLPEPVAVDPVVAEPPPVPPFHPPPAAPPGEFTSKFLAAPPPPPPPPVSNGPGEFTRKFLASQPAPTPPPPAAPPPPTPPVPQPAAMPVSEEKTKLFRAFDPAAPPPPARQPSEFSSMFPAVTPDSSPAPPPPPAPQGPSEFTGFFQSPMYPTPGGNQRPASAPPPTPQAPRPSSQPSEFTQMFGNPGQPAPGPSPSFGGSSSATGAFSAPRSSPLPPAKGSEPGEFTRMMAASAQPTLGQPQPSKGAPPADQPQAKSKLPLIIGGVAIFLVIILIILLFVFRH